MMLKDTPIIHINGVSKFLFKEYVVLVDTDMVNVISEFPWVLQPERTGRHYLRSSRSDTRRSFFLHRLILGIHLEPAKISEGVVDHINKNTFDNRRENLRFVSNRENTINKVDSKNGAYHKSEINRWVSSISQKGKVINLGYFDTKEEASEQYTRALAIVDTGSYEDLVDLRRTHAVRGIKNKSDIRTKQLKDGGAVFVKKTNRWKASIPIQGRKVLLGYFDTKEEAQAQYLRAHTMLDTCTKEDLVNLRKNHSPYAKRTTK